MVSCEEEMKDIGGLESLKRWIGNKAQVLKHMKEAESFGVELPKGSDRRNTGMRKVPECESLCKINGSSPS